MAQKMFHLAWFRLYAWRDVCLYSAVLALYGLDANFEPRSVGLAPVGGQQEVAALGFRQDKFIETEKVHLNKAYKT